MITGRENQLREVTQQEIVDVIGEVSAPRLVGNEDIYNYICHVMNLGNLSVPSTIDQAFQLYRRLHQLIHH